MTADDAKPGRSARAPAPLAADVAVVAALAIEVDDLIGRLGQVRRYAGAQQTVIEGVHAGKIVAVVAGGAGRPAARRAAELLLDGHRPRWVLSPGFAGALAPTLRRNDVVMPHEILDAEGNRLTIDVSLRPDAASESPRLLTGRLVTVDTIVGTAAAKATLRDQTGADLVDMESAEVARVCAERGVRFLSIRVISDDATSELPREVETLMNKTGSRLVGSALRAIWNRPSCVRDLLALHTQASEAADRLATVTLAAIAALPD